jgi:hypothetical protein
MMERIEIHTSRKKMFGQSVLFLVMVTACGYAVFGDFSNSHHSVELYR